MCGICGTVEHGGGAEKKCNLLMTIIYHSIITCHHVMCHAYLMAKNIVARHSQHL